MAKKEPAVCDECGSLFFKGSSQMMGLCPECAHILYGYPNCPHHFQNGRCVNCYWDGSKSGYIKELNQQEEADMPTTEWLNKYESTKDKLACKADLEAHFTEKLIGNMAVDVLDIGPVHFPTGQIFACDPLVELEDTPPFIQTIPAGTYPVKICVVPSEQYGDRYACVKVEVSQEEAIESDGETEIGGKPVKVSSHRVIDQYTPFDFALELEALPCLSEIICKQWHPDLAEFLRGNPFIHELTLLNHGQRTLDLRGTSIGKLMLDMTGLEELWLGEETEQLLFQNKGPDACTIHAAGNGSGLTLQFIGEYRPHPELPNLWGLHGIRLEEFDLTGLPVVHPSLKELRLWGAPGNLRNFSAVAQFRELTDLSTFDLFGFDAADIPTPEQMPKLHWFWMTSLPEYAAKAAKQLWKGKPGMDLRITKSRKPEWLAQNLDNPFRGWDGAEHIPASAAKKAADQYRKTRSQMMKLAAEPDGDAQTQALEAVAAYTQTFNKMRFIETEERDEIYMALRGILDALPGDTLQKDALIEQFEQLRDF